MDMVNQMSLQVSDGTLQSNTGICARKIKIQMISDEKKNVLGNTGSQD
jgi:hypothetical protein